MSEEKTTEKINDKEKQPSQEAQHFTKENFPDVQSNLFYFIQMIMSNVYIYLGMIPIPGTEDTIFDLDQAKQGIDLVEVLVNHVKPTVNDQQRRELDALVSQLQMNYVTKSNKPKESEPEKAKESEPEAVPESAPETDDKQEEGSES